MIIKQSNMEKQLEIDGYKNYIVTSTGYVISNKQYKPRILRPQKASQSKKGYYQIRLFNKEYPKGRLQYLHRLVYESFVGEIPKGKEIDHIDGDTTNNDISNLQLLGPRENKLKGIDYNWRPHRNEFIEAYEKYGTYKKVAEALDVNINIVYRVIKDVLHRWDWTDKVYKTTRFNPELQDKYTEVDRRTKNGRYDRVQN